jgi:hypothetical protein
MVKDMSFTVSAYDQSAINLNEPDHAASVLREVAVLLSTQRGSIPLYRNFGLPMRFLDMPVNAAEPVMIAEVAEALQEFIPSVELIQVIPVYDENNPARMMPSVEVRILHE